jgi:hypothetical protein
MNNQFIPIYMLQAIMESRQIRNLPGQTWNSNSARAKSGYYFDELQNLKKHLQPEHETIMDDCEGEDRCEGPDEGEGNSG